MRQKADSEKRDEAMAKASMSNIEAKAQAQYKRDLKESEQAKKNLTGTWVRRLRELVCAITAGNLAQPPFLVSTAC